MKYYWDVEQRTDEWHALRLGRITGTSFTTMANGKPATIGTLCEKTAAERITGVSSESGFTNEAMERGIELESQAIAMYEAQTFAQVQPVGFIEFNDYIGCSPDGLVCHLGGVEVKCPEQHTHLGYLLSKGKAWRKYKWQIQGALWLTQRECWDFVSYNPDFPPERQLLIERVLPDEECFAKLKNGANDCSIRIRMIMEEYNANVSS